MSILDLEDDYDDPYYDPYDFDPYDITEDDFDDDFSDEYEHCACWTSGKGRCCFCCLSVSSDGNCISADDYSNVCVRTYE